MTCWRCLQVLALSFLLLAPAAPAQEPALPEIIQGYLDEAAPGTTVDEFRVEDHQAAGREHFVFGRRAGRPIAFEIETDPADNLLEIEVKVETDSTLRHVRDAVPVERSDVPAVVWTAVGEAVKGFEPTILRKGLTDNGEAFILQGQMGLFRIEVKVLATGDLLKIEKSIVVR